MDACRKPAEIVWGALFLDGAAAMLWTNNQAWVAAGEQSNAIRQELDAIYKNEIQGDPQVLFLGLPDHIHGSYVCRNALYGMTKSPQMHRDIEHNIMVDKFEPILPFGYLKASLQEARDKVKVYRWDLQTKKFVAINLPDKSIKQPDSKDLNRVYEGQEVKPLLKVADNYGIKSFAFDDKSIATVTTETPKGRRPALQLDLNLPCFTTDFGGGLQFWLRPLPKTIKDWTYSIKMKSIATSIFTIALTQILSLHLNRKS